MRWLGCGGWERHFYYAYQAINLGLVKHDPSMRQPRLEVKAGCNLILTDHAMPSTQHPIPIKAGASYGLDFAKREKDTR